MPDNKAGEGAGEVVVTPLVSTSPVLTAKPEKLPDKFWKEGATAEQLLETVVQSYVELERAKQPPVVVTSPKAPAHALSIPPSASQELPDDASIDDVVKAAGLDPMDIGKSWAEKQTLTDEQYAAFKKIGIPKGAVNQYLEAQVFIQKQRGEQIMAQATEVAGGQDKLNTVLAWAAGGLSDEEKAYYESQVSQPASAIRGVEWLLGKYARAAGAAGSTPLMDGAPASGSNQGFATHSEMRTAMRDPRYRKDADYQAQVRNRIALTPEHIILSGGV